MYSSWYAMTEGFCSWRHIEIKSRLKWVKFWREENPLQEIVGPKSISRCVRFLNIK